MWKNLAEILDSYKPSGQKLPISMLWRLYFLSAAYHYLSLLPLSFFMFHYIKLRGRKGLRLGRAKGLIAATAGLSRQKRRFQNDVSNTTTKIDWQNERESKYEMTGKQ